MSQPEQFNPNDDPETTALVLRLLGKSSGPTPPTPEEQWEPIYDDRTGEVIGQRDPKTGRQVLYRAIPSPKTPSVAADRYAQAQSREGEIAWNGYDPVGMWQNGSLVRFTNAQQKVAAIANRVGELRDQASQYQAALGSGRPSDTDPVDWADYEQGASARLPMIQRDMGGLTSQAISVAKGNRYMLAPLLGSDAANGLSTVGGGAQRDYLGEITARAEADLQRELQVLDAKLKRGLIEGPAATREAQAAVDRALESVRQQNALAMERVRQENTLALAQEQARLRDQSDQAQWSRDLPFKQATAAREAEQLGMARRQMDFGRRQAQASILMKQAESSRSLMDEGVKLGVAPSVEMVKGSYWDPFQRAMAIMNEGVKEGWIDPAWKPTPLPPIAGNQTAPTVPPIAPTPPREGLPPQTLP